MIEHRVLPVMILMASLSMVDAGVLTQRIELDLGSVTLDSDGSWSVVTMNGAESRGEPGTPLLPAVPLVFILPSGAEGVEFSVELTDPVTVDTHGAPIIPSAPPRPFSDSATRIERHPDPFIYRSDLPWPVDPVIQVHTGSMAGVGVASCLVQPWQYRPLSGELLLYTDVEVTATWIQGTGMALTERQTEMVEWRAENLSTSAFLHGEVFSSPAIHGAGDSEYLIVCDSAFTDILGPLADLHSRQGLTVETSTVQDIVASTPGRDDAERVRFFIRDRFENSGTIFVLLAGDETLVPVRLVELECEGYWDYAPVDMYFADLDGTWDGNGDGRFGQPDDDLDLYADVLLGRALFATEDEAALFVQKNITYQETPPGGDWASRAMLCGAVLFEEQGYTAAKGCDSIAVTMPGSWDIIKAYETLGGDGFDTHIPVISSGTGWNHYAGHGNDRGIWWQSAPLGMMANWIAEDLQNGDRTGIHTSIACHPAEYIDKVCCAEALLNHPDGGAVAVLFNTSYGWEGFWPFLGASEWMCIDLARQVFRHHASTLGLAFAVAKDLRVPYLHGGYDRTFQSLLSWSAFADPALGVLAVPHVNPIPPRKLTMSSPYPNPSTRDAPVSFVVDFKGGGPATVSVHDMAGRLLWSTEVTQTERVSWPGSRQDGSRLPAGVYIIAARRADYIVSRLVTILD